MSIQSTLYKVNSKRTSILLELTTLSLFFIIYFWKHLTTSRNILDDLAPQVGFKDGKYLFPCNPLVFTVHACTYSHSNPYASSILLTTFFCFFFGWKPEEEEVARCIELRPPNLFKFQQLFTQYNTTLGHGPPNENNVGWMIIRDIKEKDIECGSWWIWIIFILGSN